MSSCLTSTEVFHLLKAIRDESSKITKIELLQELLIDDIFRKVIVYAYDPQKKYYLLKIPEEPFGTEVFDDNTWQLLDDLSNRVASGFKAKLLVRKELLRLDLQSGALFKQILNKDLACGINILTINAAMPGLIKRVPYMRCSTLDNVDINTFAWKLGAFVQEKLDGMFANIYRDNTGVCVQTRTGILFNKNMSEFTTEIEPYLAKGHHCQGELLVRKNGVLMERKEGNGILNSVLKNANEVLDPKYKIEYEAWDVIPSKYFVSKGTYQVPYETRYEFLKNLFKDTPIKLAETRRVHSFEEAVNYFDEVRSRGGEGIIIKNPLGIWRDGTSKHQVKMKGSKEADLVVVGVTEGTGKNKDTFGSLVCTDRSGSLNVNVSGFSDEERTEDWIGAIISVKYDSVIKNFKGEYSLYLPRFVERRLDKTEADEFGNL